ncbi:TPA: carbonic anhydrase, partial [Neisseria meningitidis]
MSELDNILAHNRQFVESGEYEKYFTDKYPERGLAVLSCMDARIIGLLP